MNKPKIKRYGILLWLPAVTLLLLSSCKDAAPSPGKATVEITLRTEKETESIADADVRVSCMTADGDGKMDITATMTSERIYEAVLPEGSYPAKPFIEVNTNTGTTGYTVPEICFEGGHRYRYSLMVDGNSSPDIGITVDGWETVDVELELD